MEAFFIKVAEHAEQLGVIGILIIVIGGLAWMIRHLWNSDKKCNDARLIDAEERGDIKKELGRLSGKMEAMSMLHQTNLTNLVQRSDNNTPQ